MLDSLLKNRAQLMEKCPPHFKDTHPRELLTRTIQSDSRTLILQCNYNGRVTMRIEPSHPALKPIPIISHELPPNTSFKKIAYIKQDTGDLVMPPNKIIMKKNEASRDIRSVICELSDVAKRLLKQQEEHARRFDTWFLETPQQRNEIIAKLMGIYIRSSVICKLRSIATNEDVLNGNCVADGGQHRKVVLKSTWLQYPDVIKKYRGKTCMLAYAVMSYLIRSYPSLIDVNQRKNIEQHKLSWFCRSNGHCADNDCDLSALNVIFGNNDSTVADIDHILQCAVRGYDKDIDEYFDKGKTMFCFCKSRICV